MGLSDIAPVLLNDELKGYALTKNKAPTGARLQPNNLRNKVKVMLKNAGFEWASFTTFSDSLIVHLNNNNADVNQITDLFSFRSRETVLSRINGNIVNLSDAINNIYSRIKVTGH